MKLAISGKGGVGKSTIAATLALLMSRRGQRVLAIDADPDANLAAALGIPPAKRQQIIPISQQAALIEERTGAKIKQYGQMFKLNPEVADIPEKYAISHENIKLLVLGAVDQGGGGCACPENVLIKALITDLILFKDDTLIMDMEAGVEHLGRATAKSVDKMLVVLEPGQRAVECAQRIITMSAEIGIQDIGLIANKVSSEEDRLYLAESFPAIPILGNIPYLETIRLADRKNQSILDAGDPAIDQCFDEILEQLT
jgi:CO dehydrogenase maturation factor